MAQMFMFIFQVFGTLNKVRVYRPQSKVVLQSSREPRQQPEGRPGGPGKAKRARGEPPCFFQGRLILLAFLLAPACSPKNSARLLTLLCLEAWSHRWLGNSYYTGGGGAIWGQ